MHTRQRAGCCRCAHLAVRAKVALAVLELRSLMQCASSRMMRRHRTCGARPRKQRQHRPVLDEHASALSRACAACAVQPPAARLCTSASHLVQDGDALHLAARLVVAGRALAALFGARGGGLGGQPLLLARNHALRLLLSLRIERTRTPAPQQLLNVAALLHTGSGVRRAERAPPGSVTGRSEPASAGAVAARTCSRPLPPDTASRQARSAFLRLALMPPLPSLPPLPLPPAATFCFFLALRSTTAAAHTAQTPLATQAPFA